MGAIKEWVGALPVWLKAVGALGTSFAMGLTFALLLGGWIGLPAQVAEHEVEISALQLEVGTARSERIETLHKLDRVLCLLTLPDSTRPLDAQRRCP